MGLNRKLEPSAYSCCMLTVHAIFFFFFKLILSLVGEYHLTLYKLTQTEMYFSLVKGTFLRRRERSIYKQKKNSLTEAEREIQPPTHC